MTTLGRYEILEKLGTGSMGTVYRARDTVLDREIAVKTIRTGAEVEPELRERFYREARACARLQHPSIIAVYDLGEVDQVAYIAMELLQGSDFRKVIERKAEIPVAVKIRVMAEVCDALDHAHSHGIIHRDIKPSNLFLTGKQQAKVLDFGIARLPSSRLTVAGKILGTPNYMAPEQILAKPSDLRSDLFSAAVVFFEFLVYVHPFQASVIPRRIVEGQPDSLFDYDSSLPVPFDRVFARALAKDPAERYQSGEEFAADLRTLLDAVRQNSSPTFTRFELPSDRGFPAPAAVTPANADRSLLTPPPPGEDPHEWRLSEVMRLIPEFEGALEHSDIASARRAFAQLEAIESIDSRFTNAVQLCRNRLEAEPALSRTATATGSAAVIEQEQSRSAPPPPVRPALRAESASSDPPTAPKLCVDCGASNRSAASFCIECGARLQTAAASTPKDEPVRPVPTQADSDATIILGSGPQSPSAAKPVVMEPARLDDTFPGTKPRRVDVPPSPPKTSLKREPVVTPWWKSSIDWFHKNKRVAIVSAGGLLCLLLITAFAVTLWPVKRQQYVATAAVQVKRAGIYKEKQRTSSIAIVPEGTRVNILKMPGSREQEWVAVQLVTPKKVSKPGYMRVRELGAWTSVDPEKHLGLIKMFSGGENGSDAEIRQELDALQRFINDSPGTWAPDAHLEFARLEMVQVQRLKDAGQPLSNWQGHVDSIKGHLDEAAAKTALANSVTEARAKIDGIVADANAPAGESLPSAIASQQKSPTGETRRSERPIKHLLDDVKTLLRNGKYNEAEDLINKAHRSHPHNKDVLQMQEDVLRQKEIFK